MLSQTQPVAPPSPQATVRRVLVVSPSFFGYELDIVSAFREAAGDADLIDERPGNSSVMRAASRVGVPGLRRLVAAHLRRRYEALEPGPIDLAIVIKGETTPPWFLERLRRDHPSIRIVLYAYDPIPDGHNSLRLLPLCDDAFTFDPDDARRRGMRLKHLFAGGAFAGPTPLEDRRYDVSFVGTAHSDRYRYVTAVAGGLDDRFVHLYSPARWFFALQKYVTGELRCVPWREVRFDTLTKREVADVFASSRAVVDLQRSGQSGLTMRTFEVLASGARLITSNAAVRDLDFYDPDEILVLDPSEAETCRALIAEFVRRPRHAGVDVRAHSLQAWVNSFLEEIVESA